MNRFVPSYYVHLLGLPHRIVDTYLASCARFIWDLAFRQFFWFLRPSTTIITDNDNSQYIVGMYNTLKPTVQYIHEENHNNKWKMNKEQTLYCKTCNETPKLLCTDPALSFFHISTVLIVFHALLRFCDFVLIGVRFSIGCYCYYCSCFIISFVHSIFLFPLQTKSNVRFFWYLCDFSGLFNFHVLIHCYGIVTHKQTNISVDTLVWYNTLRLKIRKNLLNWICNNNNPRNS